MKKTFIILLMWLPLLLLNAQEKAVYRITYDCHALYDKTPQTYRWNLDIGNSTAVFYNPNHRKHEEAFQSMQKTDDIAALMNSIKQLGSKYPNRSNLEILIGAPEKEAVKCTRKKYLELRKSIATQTYSEIAANVLSGTGKIVKITDASGKDITHQTQSTKNYLDIN